MCDRRNCARRGRPQRQAPQILPEDLYDYDDDPAPRIGQLRTSSPDAFDVEKLFVIDDWPEKVPITEEEIDIFERYFGDVLDRLFGPIDDAEKGLRLLTSDDNNKP